MSNIQLYCSDALVKLKELEDNSIDCIVTSPPYYGLRDYGINGQVGLEKTLDEYLNKLLEITKECKRVLRKSGTLWWNHGDSYGGTGSKGEWRDPKYINGRNGQSVSLTQGMMQKSLLMTPYRLALRMIDEQGWIMRNQIIWFKPNCMPSSVKDRFTVDYEPVFFFVKNKSYYFKQLFEPHARLWDASNGGNFADVGHKKNGKIETKDTHPKGYPMPNPQGRNKRCVWRVTTKPFKEAHFATYPEDLIEPMIKAGCPENGTVLDPFMGSGTTAIVTLKQNKNFVGIEINPKYIKIAEARINTN